MKFAPKKNRNFKTVKKKIGGTTLKAEVSPCTWLYEGYPFQITVTIKRPKSKQFSNSYGGNLCIQDKKLNNETAQQADIARLLNTVKVAKCKMPGCENVTFAASHSPKHTNRKGMCEDCFLERLDKIFALEQTKLDAQLAAQDKARKADGYQYRTTAWIHPGGDDYMLDFYFAYKPTKGEIVELIEKRGSHVLDDYATYKL